MGGETFSKIINGSLIYSPVCHEEGENRGTGKQKRGGVLQFLIADVGFAFSKMPLADINFGYDQDRF